MTCGNTEGRCAETSRPSGVPDGAGLTGQEPTAERRRLTWLAEADALVPRAPVPPAVHAPVSTVTAASAHRTTRSVGIGHAMQDLIEVAVPGRRTLAAARWHLPRPSSKPPTDLAVECRAPRPRARLAPSAGQETP